MTKEAKGNNNQVKELSDKDLGAAVGGVAPKAIGACEYLGACSQCTWSFGPTADEAAVNNAAREHAAATGHSVYIQATMENTV